MKKKKLEKNDLMLPWEVFYEVCTKPNAGFWTPLSPCTQMYLFGLSPPPTYKTYVIVFVN